MLKITIDHGLDAKIITGTLSELLGLAAKLLKVCDDSCGRTEFISIEDHATTEDWQVNAIGLRREEKDGE